jgi:hypothetical protein
MWEEFHEISRQKIELLDRRIGDPLTRNSLQKS